MIKWDKLADIEVAALLYAFERFHDDTRGYGWREPMRTLAGEIRQDANREYTKRNLHWTQYSDE